MGKYKYLMLIAVGPVQDFIHQARKTRDLWFGSYVLSEIAKAVTYALAQEKPTPEFIFPALNTDTKETEYSNSISAEKLKETESNSKLAVTNKIALLVPEETEPQVFEKLAEEAATEAWTSFTDLALANIEIKKNINLALWKKQIKEVVECYVVWVPFEEDKYGETWERAELLMAGRKALRNFGYQEISEEQKEEQKENAAKDPAQGIPKCSLSGARESVLLPTVDRKLLALNEKEHLDAIGLVKRLSMKKCRDVRENRQHTMDDCDKAQKPKESFPSVSRIAIDPWLRGVQKGGEKLEVIRGIFKEEGIFELDTDEYPEYTFFPFDVEILLPSRIDQYQEEFSNPENWKIVKNELKRLWDKYGKPLPYLAVLMADGDGMGKIISELKSLKAHQEFSQQLSDFVAEAKNIVSKGKGALVYSGGDDVFAFLPVDQCLRVARNLYNQFGEIMKDQDKNSLTLSVGILIAHCLEPLEDLRRMAREAESEAKSPDRNGLAIHLQSRSGGDMVKIRKQWGGNQGAGNTIAEQDGQQEEKTERTEEALDQRITKWSELLAKQKISAQTAYDLRQAYFDYVCWPIKEQTESFQILLKEDIERILRRKKPRGGELPGTVAELLQGLKKPEDLLELSNELIIAGFLAQSIKQAGGYSKGAE